MNRLGLDNTDYTYMPTAEGEREYVFICDRRLNDYAKRKLCEA